MTTLNSPALPKVSVVLITGVNGFIASHIADQLLDAGYKVRGTVRDESKVDWIKDTFTKRHGEGSFDVAIIKDLSVEGCFDEAMKGVSGVIHVATDVSLSPNPNDVIPLVVAGVKNILNAAVAHPDIKRFVYTSSSTAILLPKSNVKFSYGPSDWNEEVLKQAWAPPPYEADRSFPVYGASKTEAEMAFWKFIREQKPGFVANTILPNLAIGPILNPKQHGSTSGWVRGLYKGTDTETIKWLGSQFFVDVGDVARLHIAALLDKELKDERLLGFAEPFNYNLLLDIFKKISPDRTFVDHIADNSIDMSEPDTRSAVEALKRMGQPNGFVDLETCLRRTVEDL